MRNLHQQIGTTNNLLGMLEAQPCDDMLDRLSQAIEHTDQCLGSLLEIGWDEVFDSHDLRLIYCFNLSCNAGVACPELAVTADRAADRDHGKSPEPDPVRTQTHQLDRVCGRAYTAIRPYFDSSAQTRFTQGPMRFHDSNFGRQAYIAQGVGTRR